MRSINARNVIIFAVVLALALGIGTGSLLAYRAHAARVADNSGANQPPATNPPGTDGNSGNTTGNGGSTGGTTPNPGNGSTQPPQGGTVGNNSGSGNTSDSAVWIDVNVTTQRVQIMKGTEVQREMVASTGMKGYETPLGTFHIQNRGEWFFSKKYQEGAEYWVSFKDWGIYLFHSLAMDKDKNVIPEEAAKLGQPASHGCVRLAVDDAKWIYDNIKEGTKVVIHE